MRVNRKTRVGLPVLVAALVGFSAGSAFAQTAVKPGFNVFSAEQDVEIGKQSAIEAERQLPILPYSSAERYVDAIGRRLAAAAPGPKFPYSFKVVNAADINAFALPGGPVYVTRGLIESVPSEPELAGVIAHEIAHVALRHGTNNASKAYLAQAGIGILGGVLGGGGGATGQIIQAVGGLGLNALFLKFSRTAETQADIVGTQMMARAGYDPNRMASMFAMLRREQGRDPSKLQNFFSDHPSPANREARVTQEARLLGPVRTTAPVGGLETAQGDLRRMPRAQTMGQIAQAASGSGQAGSGQSTGSTGSGQVPSQQAGVERPSTRMRTFRQRGDFFQIQYPENWRVAESSNGHGVTILPNGGAVRTSNGQDVLVYGVVINHYEPFGGSVGNVFTDRQEPVTGRQGSLEQATNDLANQLVQANDHLRVVRNSTKRQTIEGARALSVVLAGVSPVTRVEERVTVFTRALPDGHVIYALFIAPAQNYSELSNTFQKMVSSLRVNENSAHGQHPATSNWP
jgi:Zn-dependent protease with chaperone function